MITDEILTETAANELAKRLPSLRKHNYNTIDQLMRSIASKHQITGKALHDLFVKKFKRTPDDWVKGKLDETGDEPSSEIEDEVNKFAQWTGTLSVVGSPVSTGTGDFPAPRGVAVDYRGKFAYVTNFYGDTVVTYEINSATGSLTAVSSISTPTGTGPLGVVVDPAGKFLYVAQTWLASYAINSATGALSFVSDYTETDSEFFNLSMNPSGDYVYGTVGINGVLSYGINRTTGTLTFRGSWQSSPVDTANGVAVDPNGKYAYVAMSGNSDSSVGGVYILSLNATTGALTQQGSLMATNGHAQALVVHPTGKFLYVTSNDTVIAYAINSTTGALSAIGSPLNLGVDSSPTGITADRSGKFVYVVNSGTNTIASFAINASTGALTSVGTTSTGANTLPKAITSY
jgi:6-phosphogluconolactonase (cycloisomerase 2 family)